MVDKKINELGYPIKIEEVRAMSWYPVGLAGAYLLVAKQILNFDETKIEEAAKAAAKFSLIEKLLGRYFLSPQKTYQMASKEWQRYFSVGILETPEINLEKKYFILQLKDFRLHPIFCIYLRGYFQAVASLVIKAKKFRCEERKCMFKGDPYHEFIARWK